MNTQVVSLIIMLGTMQLGKKYDFNDPTIVPLLRGVYLVSCSIVLGTYLLIMNRIKRKNDLTTLKYVEPPTPFSGSTEGKLVVTTIREYDIQELEKARKSALLAIAMMAFMHLYMKYSQPLIIQSIMPLLTLYDTNLFKLHILGREAKDNLKRPFKAPGGLFNAAASQPRTDKKSIEQLENKVEVSKDI